LGSEIKKVIVFKNESPGVFPTALTSTLRTIDEVSVKGTAVIEAVCPGMYCYNRSVSLYPGNTFETYACAIARRIEEVVVEIKRPVVDVRRPGRSTITAFNGVVVVNVEAERDVNIVKATQTVVQLQFNAVFVGLRDVELSTREGNIADGGTLDLVETNTTRNIYNRS
jgi:hypothetical protein